LTIYVVYIYFSLIVDWKMMTRNWNWIKTY